MTTSNNKRIAINTLMLYFRMLLTMGVSLYTVRVVLNVLGVQDYGIYNVVGGVVTSFTVISGTMSSATQRFLAFELGRKNHEAVGQVFSLSVIIYAGLAVLIFILGETIGLWFLNNKLAIPSDRVSAANWIYQFSILSFVVTMLKIPYESAVIAREQMGVYAYLSIIEVILKLIIVFFLQLFSLDKLKLYAVLVFFVALIITLLFRGFCKRRFEECKFKFFWNREKFSQLVSYSGWNIFGTLTMVSFEQGINFLLNIFFGPIINASRAISYQVNTAISSFSSNFYTAVRPQIIKSYAEGNLSYVIQMVLATSRYCFYLLLLLSLPILFETEFILKLWLGIVPAHATSFVKLTILFTLVNCLQIPITAAVQATGEVKNYQIFVGIVMLTCIPISYSLLKMGIRPESAYYVMIAVSIVALLIRLKILNGLLEFSYFKYLYEVIFKILLVSTLASILPFLLSENLKIGIGRFFLICTTSVLCSSVSIMFVGLNRIERKYIIDSGISFYKRK